MYAQRRWRALLRKLEFCQLTYKKTTTQTWATKLNERFTLELAKVAFFSAKLPVEYIDHQDKIMHSVSWVNI